MATNNFYVVYGQVCDKYFSLVSDAKTGFKKLCTDCYGDLCENQPYPQDPDGAMCALHPCPKKKTCTDNEKCQIVSYVWQDMIQLDNYLNKTFDIFYQIDTTTYRPNNIDTVACTPPTSYSNYWIKDCSGANAMRYLQDALNYLDAKGVEVGARFDDLFGQKPCKKSKGGNVPKWIFIAIGCFVGFFILLAVIDLIAKNIMGRRQNARRQAQYQADRPRRRAAAGHLDSMLARLQRPESRAQTAESMAQRAAIIQSKRKQIQQYHKCDPYIIEAMERLNQRDPNWRQTLVDEQVLTRQQVQAIDRNTCGISGDQLQYAYELQQNPRGTIMYHPQSIRRWFGMHPSNLTCPTSRRQVKTADSLVPAKQFRKNVIKLLQKAQRRIPRTAAVCGGGGAAAGGGGGGAAAAGGGGGSHLPAIQQQQSQAQSLPPRGVVQDLPPPRRLFNAQNPPRPGEADQDYRMRLQIPRKPGQTDQAYRNRLKRIQALSKRSS